METMIASCARAPVRIDLAGGWTDCRPFVNEEGMAVVNCGITRYAFATYTPSTDSQWCLESSDFEVLMRATALAEFQSERKLRLLLAALQYLGVRERGHLHSRCDVPPGGGLGSSAAVAIAIIGALDFARGGKMIKEEVCATSGLIEDQVFGSPSGAQDQYGAAFGGFNYLTGTGQPVVHERIEPPRDGNFIREFERLLLVVYTGKSHFSADILEMVMAKYRERDQRVTNALHQLRAAGENMKKAVQEECLEDIGKIMDDNWRCQRQLSPEITTSTIEAIFAVARQEGILGGKVCGAGGGGCVALLCKPNREYHVRKAVETIVQGIKVLDCRVDFGGLQSWKPAVTRDGA
jgi:D-glycero-alpha-D-manno-heptose-7-phosphate kinase